MVLSGTNSGKVMVPSGTIQGAPKETSMKKISPSGPEDPLRARILAAAFQAFGERGYAGTSTLEIATRAKLSKRDVYARFPAKQDILLACIAARTARMRPPPLPAPGNRKLLEGALAEFGVTLLREMNQPEVIAMFRLAIAEAQGAPQVAAALTRGRATPRGAVAQLLAGAQRGGMVGPGDPEAMMEQFFALLWGDLLLGRLLGLAGPPRPAEIQAKARAASKALMSLYPAPRRPAG